MSSEPDLYAPGLKRMKRHNGRVDLYWVADERLVARGYTPKTVRLHGEWPSAAIASRCSVLQAEMLEWASGREPARNGALYGTLAFFCTAFETDEDSPYHGLRQDSRRFYSKYIKKLVEKAGSEHLGDITGRDVRRWHREWSQVLGKRCVYACIQTLRRVVHYGCELRDTDAIELASVLHHTEFAPPRGRKKRPTYEQIVAFREAAHAAGRPSLALAVTLQFELGLRQKDVIGEWVKLSAAERAEVEGAISEGAWIWQWGLTWNHIDKDLKLSKPTSKSNGHETADHDLTLHPELLIELGERGVGPIVIDEHSKLPWRCATFSRTFRTIADAAGLPRDVWNMDSRAGAVSEGFDAGATPIDIMNSATHKQLSTTLLYNREKVIQSSRVAELRKQKRRKVGGDV